MNHKLPIGDMLQLERVMIKCSIALSCIGIILFIHASLETTTEETKNKELIVTKGVIAKIKQTPSNTLFYLEGENKTQRAIRKNNNLKIGNLVLLEEKVNGSRRTIKVQY